MHEAAVTARLRRAGVAQFATARRVAMLRALSSIYEEQRLLGARSAPPLHERCPDAPVCWLNVPPTARPVAGEPWGFVRDRPGSVIWPWIGEQYEPGGVALLGLNYRNGDTEATVALEYLAASNDAEQLQQGHYKSKFRSDFPYRSMATAAAVLASLDYVRPTEQPAPSTLATTMERIARLQLVKCTPVDTVVDRGAPSEAMCERCPPRFLMRELDVLRPGALVAFGGPAFRALNHRADVTWRQHAYFCRGALQVNGASTALFWLPHPSHPNWSKGQRSLVHSLRRRPLAIGARRPT
jgi:Uracil DNA glycosylase superfamily